MIRALSVVMLAFVFAAPVASQAPEGIMMRVNRSSNPQDPDDMPEVTITTVGEGFQVSTGPAVMLWREDQRASGNYTLSGRFTLLEPSTHRNYYGLVFGGRNLNSENQWYLYFMVAQTGEFVVIKPHRQREHELPREPHGAFGDPASRCERSVSERPGGADQRGPDRVRGERHGGTRHGEIRVAAGHERPLRGPDRSRPPGRAR